MITVTDTAAKKIKQQLTKRGRGVGIRLGVKTTGCSGLAYVLEYVDSYEAEVGVTNYAQPDFALLVDAKSEVYLKGLTVDWVRNGLNEGFEFRNPNERDKCGCGESFRV
jgi:iron-sulfur cluster assembly protein